MNINPEQEQDRAFDAYDHFNRFGFVLFPQDLAIYQQLGERLAGKIVMEAGCGNGVGSALLDRKVSGLRASDKLQRNVDFASCLYPWIDFSVWDFCQPTIHRAGWVVCVEAFEHAADPCAAARCLTAAAFREVWISTPNGRNKSKPPENPFHVSEYTPNEMLAFFMPLPRVRAVTIRHWDGFEIQSPETTVDPLVYQIELEGP